MAPIQIVFCVNSAVANTLVCLVGVFSEIKQSLGIYFV